MLFEPPVVHILQRARDVGPWQAEQVPGGDRVTSSLLTKKEEKKKEDFGKSYTAFRPDFYPVSLWKPLEQAQCFKAEAANLPRKVPVFNKLF